MLAVSSELHANANTLMLKTGQNTALEQEVHKFYVAIRKTTLTVKWSTQDFFLFQSLLVLTV